MSKNLTPNEINSKSYKDIEELIRNVSNCSCSECDLISCFEGRNQKSNTSCTCSVCKQPKTCGDSKKNVSDKKLNSTNVNNTKIKNEIDHIEKELYEEITKVANSELDNREYTKFSSKDISLRKDKMERNMKGTSYEKSSTRQFIHSVAINYLPKERKDSTAKLSAQIMNMPYQDFKDSLSIDDSHKKTTPFIIKDIIKPDLFTRLREIYNACSCKVCECITGKSLPLNNDLCNCKPCECEECTKHSTNIRMAPHDGCPCVRCDRKNCKGVVKTNQDKDSCSCVPCDCVKCSENFTKSCNCEPCQCVECNALGATLLRTLIVAPVHGNIQQNMCDCEPCECVNCTHNYSPMSSLRRQVSTEIVSNTICHCERCLNDACQINSGVCRCDNQSKVMKKPIERANRDYDIHRTLINRRKRNSEFNNHDTIVTFALCNNNYSNTVSYSKSNCHDCQCSECECFVCKEKNEFNNEDNKIYNEMFNKYSKPSLHSHNTCRCSPCECQMCNESHKQKNRTEEQRLKNTCNCNRCDCFVCKGLLKSKNNINAVDWKDINSSFHEKNNISCEKSNFLRKGNILTPSTFEANMRLASKLQSYFSNENLKKETENISYLNVPANKSFCRKESRPQTVMCHTQSNHNNVDRIYEKVNIHQNFEFPPENILLNDHCENADLNNIVEDINTLKKSITFIKKSTDINDNTCEIFNAKRKKHITYIKILDKYIHLVKSSSKTNVKKEDYRNNNIETAILDIEPVKHILQVTPTESVHTMDSENINFDDQQNYETLHTSSSKFIILCDKITASNVFEINSENNVEESNARTKNNNVESDYKVPNFTNPADSIDIQYNGKMFNDESNDIVDLKSDDLDTALNDEEKQSNIVNSETIQQNHKTLKRSKKCKGKKYIKMYSKFNKAKRKDDKAKVNGKDIKINDHIEPETEEDSNSNVFEKDKKTTKGLRYPVRNERDLGEPTEDSQSTTSVDKMLASKNILSNMMETQTQNIDSGDNNDAWSVIRKNLYLSCPHVVKSKGICTIPAMEFDIKTSLKSISMQTSECAYKIGKSNGKHALTRLLNEVNNLLNSPLLRSSHSNNTSADLIQESNNLSKSKLDLELKIGQSDATSQTHSKSYPIDKETYCNLIQSMETLQQSIKNLMDIVLTNAVYKSELSTTKFNLVHGCTQNIPKINSCRSSCHGLKATFIGLRTISDHTVMVKWRLPREVIYVQGYELQVDGRPVQKIFSPTRCMAILTCLPHSEKLLLTIRTLTTPSLLSDHQPTTTIVYRPRVKCI